MLLEIITALGLLYLAFWFLRMRHQRVKAADWTLINATIETVRLENRGHYSPVYDADVSYSYCAENSRFSGTVSVPASWWKREPSPELVGREIKVRVHPTKPSESVVVSATLPGIDESAAPFLLLKGANR
jgi:hypothetical protein